MSFFPALGYDVRPCNSFTPCYLQERIIRQRSQLPGVNTYYLLNYEDRVVCMLRSPVGISKALRDIANCFKGLTLILDADWCRTQFIKTIVLSNNIMFILQQATEYCIPNV